MYSPMSIHICVYGYRAIWGESTLLGFLPWGGKGCARLDHDPISISAVLELVVGSSPPHIPLCRWVYGGHGDAVGCEVTGGAGG